MYYNDHNPPHFHAQYGEYRADIRIHDLAILKGILPPKAIGLVTEWALLHQEELENNWEASRQKKQLSPISPLK